MRSTMRILWFLILLLSGHVVRNQQRKSRNCCLATSGNSLICSRWYKTHKCGGCVSCFSLSQSTSITSIICVQLIHTVRQSLLTCTQACTDTHNTHMHRVRQAQVLLRQAQLVCISNNNDNNYSVILILY